jgi:hypothetical protein
MINKRLSVLLLTLVYFQIKAEQDAEVNIDKEQISVTSVQVKSDSPEKGSVNFTPDNNQKIQLFRDTSWRVYSTYNNRSSIYTILPRLYEDKVTFKEETTSNFNYLFHLLADIIPAQYNINTGKTTIWNLDPFDAIDLGIQVANGKIVQSCLDILPVSRASAPKGSSLDWRKKIEIKDKFDITQKLTINTEALMGKINRGRIKKSLAAIGGILSWFGLSNNKLFCDQKLTDGNFSVNDTQFNLKALKPLTASLASSIFLITQYVETNDINNHINVYELLINSDKVTFNKAQVKSQLKKLERKIRRFKFHKKAGERLKTLIEKL